MWYFVFHYFDLVEPTDAATTPQSSTATTKGLNASAMNLTTSTNTTQLPSTKPSEKNIHVLTTGPEKKTAKTQISVPVFDPSNNFDLERLFDSAQGIKCNAEGIFSLVLMTSAILFLRL